MGQSDLALKQIDRVKAVLIERSIPAVEIPERIRISNGFRMQISFFVGGILDMDLKWIQDSLECTVDELIEQVAKLPENNADAYEICKNQ